MTRVLIDGDIIAYRCAAAAQKTVYDVVNDDDPWPIKTFYSSSKKEEGASGAKEFIAKLQELYPDTHFSIRRRIEEEPLDHALFTTKRSLQNILDSLGSSNYSLYISPQWCFRDDVATIAKYKGNRDRDQRPVHYESVREYLQDSWKAEEVEDGLEADDKLAIEAFKSCIVRGKDYYPDSIIATIDKDLDQIWGRHFNFVSDKKYIVTPKQAYETLWTQVITGDVTDNIKGLPGGGPALARKLCSDASNEVDLAFRVKDRFIKELGKEKGIEWFVENGTLVYLLRSEKDSFVKHCERLEIFEA